MLRSIENKKWKTNKIINDPFLIVFVAAITMYKGRKWIWMNKPTQAKQHWNVIVLEDVDNDVVVIFLNNYHK